MRVAAAGLLAIAAAVVIALGASARADDASPFPSPSPVATLEPGAGGYALVGIAALNASGGEQPGPAKSPAPITFASAGASGYSLELEGRLSPRYVSMLRFEDENIHGKTPSVESRFDISALYQFTGKYVGVGVGYASVQRSTIGSASNGLGAGVVLLPNFGQRISPYGSLFYYPSLTAPGPSRGGLSVVRLGLTLTPQHATGVFARVGITSQNFSASTFSPTSISGVEVGVGATF